MYTFSQTAIKLLRDYKALIRRQLPPEESDKRLSEMQLNKKLPTKENALYELLEKIVQKTEANESSVYSRLRYCGAVQLRRHIQTVLDVYQIHNKRVIHSSQLASRALIHAIQLLKLSVNDLTSESLAQLNTYAGCITKHGTSEQRAVFVNALQSCSHVHCDFFQILLKDFQEK